MSRTYVNRAHCDWIEIALESGVVGIAMLIVFCTWFLRVSISLWRSQPGPGAGVDLMLMRTVVIVLVGLHSIFEYPLRTGALAAIFAFACGCLFTPIAAERAALTTRR